MSSWHRAVAFVPKWSTLSPRPSFVFTCLAHKKCSRLKTSALCSPATTVQTAELQHILLCTTLPLTSKTVARISPAHRRKSMQVVCASCQHSVDVLQANKLVLGDLPSLPGSNVKSGDLPNGPQPFTDKYSSGGSSGNKVWLRHCILYPNTCTALFITCWCLYCIIYHMKKFALHWTSYQGACAALYIISRYL